MNKSERINDMIMYLNDKEFFNLKDIMQKYSISRNTALRDIRSLEEIGMPVYSTTGRNGKYGILKNKLLSPVMFNIDEMYALYFTMITLKGYKTTPFYLDIEKLKEKFKACLPRKQIEEISKMETVLSFESSVHYKESPYLKDILKFAIKEKVCKILYKEEKAERAYFIQFFKITSAYGQWFTIGYDFKNSEIKNFQCDKIIKLSENDKFKSVSLKKLSSLNPKVYKIFDYSMADFEIEIEKNKTIDKL
ncbi:helix-turn-helix transcriptional regulator [Pseudoleptotrichia goodfellowii]|uniref:HTH domain protein n=1 Tax=Pseudoleptotrichia goodfellowii F0264 TaxID=596323 RepID=D0GME1_9FUSO|nr:HTH domain-containing protein [Pseudoleptotrichia goodfellowii]EEY34755.1 HTH domain protein [Pseudoleptotrichia goodfellowii F0264]MBF4806111.1 HTH domain-containing protein [Pseudoleptotrichia goodfellowii]